MKKIIIQFFTSFSFLKMSKETTWQIDKFLRHFCKSKHAFYYLLLCAMFILTQCGKDPVETPPVLKVTLNVPGEPVLVAAQDTQKEVPVSATGAKWSATESADWITSVNMKSGTSDKMLIKFSVNATGLPREAEITVKAEKYQKKFTLKQSNTNSSVVSVSPPQGTKVDASGAYFPSAANNNVSVAVAAPAGWTVSDDVSGSGSANWLEATKPNNTTMKIVLLENATDAIRTGNVTISLGGSRAARVAASVVITVTQTNTESASITVNPRSLMPTAAGGTETITVTAPTGWTVTDNVSGSGNANWLEATQGDATTINVRILENTTTNSRPGTITITAGSDTADVEVTQAAGSSNAVNFASATYSGDEGGSATITVDVDTAPGGTNSFIIPIAVVTSGNNPAPGDANADDYTLGANSVTITGTATSGTVVVDLHPNIDNATADDPTSETLVLQFGSLPSGLSAGTVTSTTITITDVPSVQFEMASYRKNADVMVKVQLSEAAGGTGVSIPIAVNASSTAMYTTDYTLPSGSINNNTVTIGATAREADFLVTIPSGATPGNTIVLDIGDITTTPIPVGGQNLIEGTTTSATITISAIGTDVSLLRASKAVGTATIMVTAPTGWTVSDDVSGSNDWLTVAKNAAGTAIDVSFTSENTTNAERTGTITITSGTETLMIPVTQTNTESAHITVNPRSLMPMAAGGTETITVTAPAGWTVADDVSGANDWLTVAKNATNDGINVSILINAEATSRSGTITITAGMETATIAVEQTAVSMAVNFASATYPGNEGGSVTVTVNVDMAPGIGNSFIIPIEVVPAGNTNPAPGDANAHDYTLGANSVTITGTATSGNFTVNLHPNIDNTTADDPTSETLVLQFGSIPAGLSAGTVTSTTITITDVPSVTFESGNYRTSPGNNVTVKVLLSTAPSASHHVAIDIGASATKGNATVTTDYTLPTPSNVVIQDTDNREADFMVTIPAGATLNKTLVLEMGTITPPLGENFIPGTYRSTNVTIANSVNFELATYQGNEGTDVVVTVEVDAASSTGNFVIPIEAFTGGTVPADAHDYTLPDPASVTIASGGDGTATFTVALKANIDDLDNDDPAAEIFGLRFGTLPSELSLGTTSETTIKINDVPTVVFEHAEYSAPRYRGAQALINVQLSEAPGYDASGTANEVTIRVRTVGVAGGGLLQGRNAVHHSRYSIVAAGKDPTPIVGSIYDQFNNPLGRFFCLTFSGNSREQSFAVTWSDGHVIHRYVVPLRLGILRSEIDDANTRIDLASISCNTSSDTPQIGGQDVVINRTVFGEGMTFVSVGVDAALSFSQKNYSGSEGGTVTITVNLHDGNRPIQGSEIAGDGNDLVIPLRALLLSDGSHAGTADAHDYTLPATLTIPADASTGTADIALHANIDDMDADDSETAESLIVRFGDVSALSLSIGDNHSANIAIEEGPASIQFEQSAYTVHAGETVDVKVRPSHRVFTTGGSVPPLDIPVSVASASTAATTEYTLPSNSSRVRVGGGDRVASYSIGTAADAVVGKTIILEMGAVPANIAPGGRALIKGVVGTTTITIAPAQPETVAFRAATYEGAEGTVVAVEVVLSEAPALNTSVEIPITYSSTDGAAAGVDYRLYTAVLFANSSNLATFSVTLLEDFIVDDESIVLTLGDITGKTVNGKRIVAGTTNSTTVTIQDTPRVRFAAAAYEGSEGNEVTVVVELSEAPGGSNSVVVPITTATESSATEGAGNDYTAATSVTFTGTSTSENLVITLNSDTDEESKESILLEIGSLTGKAIGGANLLKSTGNATTTVGILNVSTSTLIPISSLEQLYAIRYDLDGNGNPTGTSAERDSYNQAFTGVTKPGSPTGYKLTRDLDFFQQNSYAIARKSTTEDYDFLNAPTDPTELATWTAARDVYNALRSGWTSASGWEPIGSATSPFRAEFSGGNYKIANLFIDREGTVGLFGFIKGASASDKSIVSGLKLKDPQVSGGIAGSLVGEIKEYGEVKNCVATSVDVMATGTAAGGLVGENYGTIRNCYVSQGEVTSSLNPTSEDESGAGFVGGLLGVNYEDALVAFSYAKGDDSEALSIKHETSSTQYSHMAFGGLVGGNKGRAAATTTDRAVILGSYVFGEVSVTGTGNFTGGLVGYADNDLITACYVKGGSASAVDDYNPTDTETLSDEEMNLGIGTLVGGSSSSKIQACYTSNVILGNNVIVPYVMVGVARGTEITACYAINADTPLHGVIHAFQPRTEGGEEELSLDQLEDHETGTDLTINDCYVLSGLSTDPDAVMQLPVPNRGLVVSGYQEEASLQEPTSTSGIYADWDIDVDEGLSIGIENSTGSGDTGSDDPWDFGTNSQYPVLDVDFDGDGSTADDIADQRN